MNSILFLILISISICSLVGILAGLLDYFDGLWWLFDLFNHFRLQALLSSLVLLFLSLVIKDKRCIILAFAVIALNSALIIERFYAFPAAKYPSQISYIQGKTEDISVLFSNVLRSNSQHQLFLDTTSRHNPDIIVTTEIDETWKNALIPIQSTYIHSVVIPRSDNFGMAIYSKLPFKSEQYNVGNYQLPLMLLDFDTFILIAAHPIPPISHKNYLEIHAYMSEIATVLAKTEKPVVLVGDFNTTIFSDIINNLRGLNLVRTNQLGFAWTWPSGFWLLGLQIDHIFVRDAVMADFEVLPYIGSDHFPVKSNITLYTQPEQKNEQDRTKKDFTNE
jgi:endonuclease/exonuclease/phosphatase (EEP) superfamily protein YafD